MEDDEGRDSMFLFSFQNKIHSILILSTGDRVSTLRPHAGKVRKVPYDGSDGNILFGGHHAHN